MGGQTPYTCTHSCTWVHQRKCIHFSDGSQDFPVKAVVGWPEFQLVWRQVSPWWRAQTWENVSHANGHFIALYHSNIYILILFRTVFKYVYIFLAHCIFLRSWFFCCWNKWFYAWGLDKCTFWWRNQYLLLGAAMVKGGRHNAWTEMSEPV